MFNLFNSAKFLLELKAENKKLKNELYVSNCRIVDSAKEIESLKIDYLFYYTKACSLQQSLEYAQVKLIQQDGLPSVEDVKDALKYEKKFSSRFMPNVKFKTFSYNINLPLEERFIFVGLMPNSYYFTMDDGRIFSYPTYNHFFTDFTLKEVNPYEAIPELIPDGMMYNKESDSLIKKVCSNQMCQGEWCGCHDM